MNEDQAAQIIADAEALQTRSQLDGSENGLGIQTGDQNNLLRSENVLHFNNRTAVIQIQHNSGDDMTGQSVLTIPEQQLTGQTMQAIKDLQQQPSTDIGEIGDQEQQQSFIQDQEQIVSSISENDVDVERAYNSINL